MASVIVTIFCFIFYVLMSILHASFQESSVLLIFWIISLSLPMPLYYYWFARINLATPDDSRPLFLGLQYFQVLGLLLILLLIGGNILGFSMSISVPDETQIGILLNVLSFLFVWCFLANAWQSSSRLGKFSSNKETRRANRQISNFLLILLLPFSVFYLNKVIEQQARLSAG
ncbi:hypothetical protein [Hyphococcus luteus]|uniref:hypothetical protein n=1 Tax=Hyphococcus luteus TaxID=2058213 RepID=UPI00105750EE|nr:hypothetical protein [Marinicaulis flavus]